MKLLLTNPDTNKRGHLYAYDFRVPGYNAAEGNTDVLESAETPDTGLEVDRADAERMRAEVLAESGNAKVNLLLGGRNSSDVDPDGDGVHDAIEAGKGKNSASKTVTGALRNLDADQNLELDSGLERIATQETAEMVEVETAKQYNAAQVEGGIERVMAQNAAEDANTLISGVDETGDNNQTQMS